MCAVTIIALLRVITNPVHPAICVTLAHIDRTLRGRRQIRDLDPGYRSCRRILGVWAYFVANRA